MTSLVQTWLTWIYWMPMLAQQDMDLESSRSVYETILASGVQAGTDCRPSRCCSALTQWLWVCQTRQWRCPAAVHRHDLFGCSCELELIEPPAWASTGGRQVGLERKARRAWASWAEAKLGQNLKYNQEISSFQGWSSCTLNLNHHDWRSCEFFVLLLFSLFNDNKS